MPSSTIRRKHVGAKKSPKKIAPPKRTTEKKKKLVGGNNFDDDELANVYEKVRATRERANARNSNAMAAAKAAENAKKLAWAVKVHQGMSF